GRAVLRRCALFRCEHSYFCEQCLPLIVGIKFEKVVMISDPRSHLGTSRTACKSNRFSTVFSQKEETHRVGSGIPLDFGTSTSVDERYVLGLCRDTRPTPKPP